MKKVLLISFSGGRTSAYMTHLILNGCLKNQYTQKYDEDLQAVAAKVANFTIYKHLTTAPIIAIIAVQFRV